MIYRKFKLNKDINNQLSDEDKKVLKILEAVVRDVSAVYQLQKKEGFYPRGITKKQLEDTSKKDSEILSPFTYIIKTNGKLKAIPYHERYAQYLRPLAKKIDQAAILCHNKSFKDYLKARSRSLLDGSYREADIAWLNVKTYKIDFSIGPFERYLDKTLFIKRVFQAHVGVIDPSKTNLAAKIKEVLYSSAKLSPSKYHSTQIPQKGVNVLWEHISASAGYMSEVVFSGEHFPCDLDLMEQYGSKILIYQSQFKLKFDKLYFPIFKSIFEKRFASKYSKELLFNAVGLNVVTYELSKQLHKFRGARERLQEIFGPIDEANGFASGIVHCKYLLIKGLISQEELEAIMIIHILWMFADWLFYTQNQAKESHVLGNSILLNAYLTSGALKVIRGISWPNFPKIFFEIETIANQLIHILQEGSYKDAQRFIKKNANLKNFEILGKKLIKINPRV